jgi:hypothetical protein
MPAARMDMVHEPHGHDVDVARLDALLRRERAARAEAQAAVHARTCSPS